MNNFKCKQNSKERHFEKLEMRVYRKRERKKAR